MLVQKPNLFGLMTCRLFAAGRPITALVGALVLKAFGQPRPGGGFRIEHIDGDPGNCTPTNLVWAKKGGCDRVKDRKERTCLGPGCGVTFLSDGPGNRLCGSCRDRAAKISGGLDFFDSGELPDAPLLDFGGTRRR